MLFTPVRKAFFGGSAPSPRLAVKVTSRRLSILAVYGHNEHFLCPGVCPLSSRERAEWTITSS